MSSKTNKIILYVKDKGIFSLIVLSTLLLFKKLSARYTESNYPWIHRKVTSLLIVFSDYYGKHNIKGNSYSLPNISSHIGKLNKNDRETIIQQCDLLVNDKFKLDCGYTINVKRKNFWQLDPLTEFIYPLTMDRILFHSELDQHDGDLRLLWEVNRLQYLVLLAQGYVLTRNGLYIKKIHQIYESWKEENPINEGVNWFDAQDVGIRMVSLLVCRSLLNSSGYNDKELDEWECMIISHGEFVFKHLSIARSTHNHFMTELTSLFVFSSMIEQFRYKYLWLYLSRFLLRREIKNQLNVDGLSAEGSTNYTFFVYDAILFAHHIHNMLFSNDLIEEVMLEEMVQVIEQFTISETDIVKIGDADCGRYIRIDWEASLSRHGYISLINSCFRNQEMEEHSTDSKEVFWLVPETFNNIESSLKEVVLNPVVYELSGYLSYIRQPVRLYLRFGPPVVNNEVKFGHTHSDFLSFILYKEGNQVFIDPGTYTYLGRESKRATMRSALVHNTITLDDCEFLDVHQTVFGLPVLNTVMIGDLQKQSDIYIIGARYNYSESDWLGRIFVFNEKLTWLILVNIANSRCLKQMQEHYSIPDDIHVLGEGIKLNGESGRLTASIDWVSSGNAQSQISQEETIYAPHYGIKRQCKTIHRFTELKNGRQLTATVISLDEETNLRVNFSNNNNKLTIHQGSSIFNMDIYRYLPES